MPIDIEQLRPHIELRADRAAGPGGQHVNKTSSRVTLLVDFENCPELSDWAKGRIRNRLATRIGKDGRLRVVAQEDRSQHANRAIAEDRIIALIKQALRRETPRRPTRPTRGSQERRLKAKKERGAIKQQRQRKPRMTD